MQLHKKGMLRNVVKKTRNLTLSWLYQQFKTPREVNKSGPSSKCKEFLDKKGYNTKII